MFKHGMAWSRRVTVLAIFQLHLTLRFVSQRRPTVDFILEGRCQQ